ncbi:nitrate/nitrite transporter [Paenibacillus sp. GCM10012307]|uniref:MFS transporter n=1 Tax=Paenibacillus roseus TaxID=2798579 RepID=A0A934J7B2_9BACL|nr:MFS transporter [Paenibacillus roseus]MBJ6361717.1 MFS transporter [Paenibacillus roseus]
METKNYSRYFQFFLIILAAGSIYPLIYLKTNYQETILEVFGISLVDLNGIFSVLGIAFILGYFPSGWLADRFSSKKLIFTSLLVCGLTGIWFAQVPSYPIVLVIFTIWGIFSVFTFWSAHLKLVKLISKKEEEGRFFGALDGGKGIVEAILASIAILIFSNILGASSEYVHKKEALQAVVYMYSAVLIVVAILFLIFVKEDKSSIQAASSSNPENKTKFDIRVFKQIFNNKFVWLLGGIIFTSYIVAWSVYYLGGFLQTNININAATVGQVTVIMLWMRPVGGFLGGFLGDRFGKSSILIAALGMSTILLFTVALTPVTLPHMFYYVLIITTGLMVYIIRGLYWSLLGDCNIKEGVLGLSIGFISFLGYLPDIIIPFVNIYFFKTYGDNGGYNAYFTFCALASVAAIMITVIFKMNVNKRNKRLVGTAE